MRQAVSRISKILVPILLLVLLLTAAPNRSLAPHDLRGSEVLRGIAIGEVQAPIVTPHSASVNVLASTTDTLSFEVENTSGSGGFFLYSLDCTGAISSCDTDWDGSIGPNDEEEVLVVITTGSSGSGQVTLGVGGGGYDEGVYSVTIVPAVQVTHLSQPDTIEVGEQAAYLFDVENTGSTSATYTLTCSKTGPATCGAVTPNSVLLGPGQDTLVQVTATAATPPGQAWLILNASGAGSDKDSVRVTVIPTIPSAVSVADANPGVTPERDLCLTFSVTSNVAVECGDLRIVHPITGARTMNKFRAPTLLYNSRLAQVAPILAAHVRLAVTAAVPTRVTATLFVKPAGTANWVSRATGEWQGGDFNPGDPTRISLSYEAVNDVTGLYDYRYDVTTWQGTTPTALPSASGQLILVNRSNSPFGAGWWMAGVEQLVFVTGGKIAWIGGDGSARLYSAAGTGKWVAPSVDRPDTLIQSGSGYARILPEGLVVYFNSSGQHVSTITRLGHVTSFKYTSGRLSQIELPIPETVSMTRYCSSISTCLPPLQNPPIPIGPSYFISYPAGQVTITAPPSPVPLGSPQVRTTVLTLVGGVVQSIRDADSVLTYFESGTGNLARRVAARTDRRGTETRFGYTSHAHLVISATTDSAGAPWIQQQFNPIAESQGLGLSGTTAPAMDVADVLTLHDGPRTDVVDTTRFWVNRFGAPTKIHNALGHETSIERGDARFPALVTEVVAPNGFTTRATYDTRGNLATTTAVNPLGDSEDAVTSYSWNQTFDFIEEITLPEEETTTFAYDWQTGNRLWQQDERGISSRISFSYYPQSSLAGPPGLLQTAELPGGARDTLKYDKLGNLSSVWTPDTTWTKFVNDSAGRTTVVRKQIIKGDTTIWQEDSTTYDRFDRATRSVSYGPSLGGVGAQKVIVRNFYNVAGQLDSLQRIISPTTPTNLNTLTTHWRYDPAGRVIAELAPDNSPVMLNDNPVDSTFYDKAGNVVAVSPRRRAEGARVEMVYDALNRIIERTLYAVTYNEREEGIADSGGTSQVPAAENPPYPRYGVDSQGKYVIPQDVATFDYDAAGNQILADNGAARVRRSYYPSGLLRRDSLYIRAVGNCPSGSNPFACHAYGLELTYDLNGRRLTLKHPSQLVSGSGAPRDYVAYTYDAQTGTLKTVTDIMNNQSRYHYNLRSELDSLYVPFSTGEPREGYGYDLAGNRTTHRVWDPINGLIRDTRQVYNARGKIDSTINTKVAADTMVVSYSGLGHVVASWLAAWGVGVNDIGIRTLSVDSFTLDALGNLSEGQTQLKRKYTNGVEDTSITSRESHYEAGTGRLALAQGGVFQTDTTQYDAGGNIVFSTTLPQSNAVLTDRASFYASDGSLHAAERRSTIGWNGFGVKFASTFEEFRYDALGRRVLVRTRRFCNQGYGQFEIDECNLSTVRRTVWDGSQELWEIQMPGGTQTPVDTLENDVAFVKRALTSNSWDLNPYFGRTTYTHGLSIDQPLSVVRLGYSDAPYPRTWKSWGPFTIVPFWNSRGQPDMAVFTVGGTNHCDPGDPTRCVRPIEMPAIWTVYGGYVGSLTPSVWYGTLLENKTDKTGTLYRRNRVYDPKTGRFTQEDPIGFAGGLNLYGFAGGDPVNFSDPFGLCPPEWMCRLAGAMAVKAAQHPKFVDFVSREAQGFACGIDGACMSYPPGGSAGWFAGRLAFVTGLSAAVGATARTARGIAPRAAVAASGGADEFVTLYHAGELVGGKVSATRSLSTSLSKGLGHYHPGQSIQEFRIPRSVFQSWEEAGYVTRMTDLNNGIITSEIRIEAGASGALNNYLVKP